LPFTGRPPAPQARTRLPLGLTEYLRAAGQSEPALAFARQVAADHQKSASQGHKHHDCALPHLQPRFLGPCEGISHHAVRRRAMLILKRLFGFAASTSVLTVLMVLLGQVG
jgi:hypothetical protein